MNRARGKIPLLVGMILVICLAGLGNELNAQPQEQETTEKAAQKIEPSPVAEEIHAGPKDIKEEIGIYVFLGWLWLSIFVMIYLLRQKIRETDRLHAYRYFTAVEKKPSVQDPT